LDIGKVISERIFGIDRQRVTQGMNERGRCMVLCFPSIPISISRPQRWKDILFRFGEDKYFKYPLPDLIQTVRRAPCSLPKDFAMTIDQQSSPSLFQNILRGIIHSR